MNGESGQAAYTEVGKFRGKFFGQILQALSDVAFAARGLYA